MAQHIPVGNICDGHGDHLESVLHALWLCDQVRSVWISDPVFLFLVQAKCRSFMELLEVLFAHGLGFCIAQELCLFEVIFEGDCSRVLDALKGSGHCRTLFVHMIDEAKREVF